MTAPRARLKVVEPIATDDALTAAIDAVLAQVVADFASTTHLGDGTRSAQMVKWTAEIRADIERFEVVA